MLKGHGAPSTSVVGNVGDYFEDLDTGKIYRLATIVLKEKEMGFVTIPEYVCETNQYVWVEASVSGPVSWDALTDKPFDEPTYLPVDPMYFNDIIVDSAPFTFNGNYPSFLMVSFGGTEYVLDVKRQYPTSGGEPLVITAGDETFQTVPIFIIEKVSMSGNTSIMGEIRLGFNDGRNRYTQVCKANPGVTTIPVQLLPKIPAVPNVTSAPTAEDFNALLNGLRQAGYLNLQ